MKAFLSYRQENDSVHPNHSLKVRQLGERLKASGFEVLLDQFYLIEHPGGPDEQWPSWCEQQVQIADRVLMVASAGYFQCYDRQQENGQGLGAACETTVIRNTLYDSSYATDKFRIVYFDKSHLNGVPIALKGLHKFDANDEDDVKSLVAWLHEAEPASSGSATAQPGSIAWPGRIDDYKPDLANRCDEFEFVKAMLNGKTPERAVFFEGPSNHGKTGLLFECMEYAHRTLQPEASVTVDFKVNPSKEAVLDTLRMDLIGVLPNFCKPNGNIGDLRRDFRSNLRPTLLIFDTYEKSSHDAREVILTLLADIEKCPALLVIIAGQTVPDHSKVFWARFVRYFGIGPIRETKQWHEYTSRHYPKLKAEHVEAITILSGGVPGVQVANLMMVNSPEAH